MTNRKILVTTGYETDQNNALVEMVIPSTVKTLNAPRKVTFMGETLNYVPSTADALQEFEAPNLTSLTDNNFFGFTNLQSLSCDNVITITCTGMDKTLCKNCTKLETVYFPNLESVYTSDYNGGVIVNCVALESLSLPELLSITQSRGGAFRNNTGLTTVTCPKLSTISQIGSYAGNAEGAFANDTALTTVQLGSDGYAVTSIHANTFYGCTQSGLTITIYTEGGAALSGSPCGATNATIVYEEA